MSNTDEWFTNMAAGPLVTDTFLTCNYVTVALGGFILIHSFTLNGLRYPQIRVLVDTCAVGGILAASANLIYSTKPSDVHYSAIFPNLLAAGIFNIPLQLPDNLLFLYAYIALSTAGRARRYMRPAEAICTALFITFVLFFPFMAPVTFIPLIIDENDPEYFKSVGLPLLQGYCIGYLLWNFYFSTIFVRVLYRCWFDPRSLYPPVAAEICIKCLLHWLVSSYAVLQFYFFGIVNMQPWAGPVYSLLIMASMHFIFNKRKKKVTRRKPAIVQPEARIGP